jgi:hypothetical protein
MVKSYAIKTPRGFVAGFGGDNKRVHLTVIYNRIKKFDTAKEAEEFIDKYSDMGYYLERSQTETVEISYGEFR